MSETAKCTSWRGHKFQARFSEQPMKLPSTEQLFWLGYIQQREIIKGAVKRIYERDICVRCGVTIERHITNETPK